jgi:hypothetical protein
MTLYYKNGNYRMAFNGNDIKDIYYIRSSNTQYAVRNGIDTLYVAPCGTESRTLLSSTYTANAEKILKKNCNLIVNNIGDAVNYYWFDPKIYVNPENFKQHVYGHVNVYFEKAQSFWIKYRFEAVYLTLTHTAINVKRTKVPDSVFKLPAFPERPQY